MDLQLLIEEDLLDLEIIHLVHDVKEVDDTADLVAVPL